MRSEHKLCGVEEDALTRAKRYYRWRPGERKSTKRRAHHIDRQRQRAALRRERQDDDVHHV